MFDSGASSPPGAEEFKAIRWLHPIALKTGNEISQSATISVDPNDKILPTIDRRLTTEILLPENTPIDSLVVAVSLKAKKIITDGKDTYTTVPLVQTFRVALQENGKKMLVPENLSVALEDTVVRELPVENTPEAVELRKQTRKLTFETATDEALAAPKKSEVESICQRLSSQSPNIEVGLITKADLAIFNNQKNLQLNWSHLNQKNSTPLPQNSTPLPSVKR